MVRHAIRVLQVRVMTETVEHDYFGARKALP